MDILVTGLGGVPRAVRGHVQGRGKKVAEAGRINGPWRYWLHRRADCSLPPDSHHRVGGVLFFGGQGCCDAEGLCYERAGARTQPTIRPGARPTR